MTGPPTTWQTWTTVAILVLSTISSLLGIFRPDHYRDPDGFLAPLFAQDLTILLIGVPVLAIGLWAARRGSLRGYLLWVGALSYMTYMWATFAFALAWNEFFLGYVALFGLSLFTLVGGIVRLDETRLSEALDGNISSPIYSVFLWVIAAGLAALWLVDLVPPMLAGTPPTIVEELGEQATVSHAIDLAVVVPALAIAGAWLWKRRPWGYALAGVVLLLGALLAPTIAAMTLVLVLEGAVTVPLPAIVFTLVPIVIAAVLALRYLLAIGSQRQQATSDGSRNRQGA